MALQALNLVNPGMNVAIRKFRYAKFDMSMLSMYILHNILHKDTEEIKAWEHMVYEKLKQLKSQVATLETNLEESTK